MKNRIDERLYGQIMERMQSGDPIDDLLQNYEAYDIRNLLEEAAAKKIGNKNPIDFFQRPEVLKDIKIKSDPNFPAYGEFRAAYNKDSGLINPKSGIITLNNPNDKASLIHELQHGYDDLSDLTRPGYFDKELDENAVRKSLGLGSKQELKGLETATEMFGQHFRPEPSNKFGKLKQILNLERLAKGQPLKAIAPIAVGAAAFGVGEKAMAGDMKGAKQEAGQLALDLAIPDLITSDSVNTNEQQMLDEYRRQNETPEVKRFNKIRNIMENNYGK